MDFSGQASLISETSPFLFRTTAAQAAIATGSCMSLHTEFDKSSLVWVKGEIEETLARARESLLQYSADGSESSLRHAQTHIHQACGALTMVDLAGLSRFCEEVEQILAQPAHIKNNPEAAPLLLRAIDSSMAYLNRLMAGMSNTPMLLGPLFCEIAAVRGNRPSKAELFFPDLQLDLPDGLPRLAISPDEMKPFLLKQRRRFEGGLLRWLQGQKQAAQVMAASLADIASCQQTPVVRTFWWTAAALVLGLSSNRSDTDLDSRQLLMRLNLQMRRLVEGSGKVAERLFRDMLYVLAHMDCDSNLVQRMQKAFELGDLIPTPEALAAGVELGSAQLARGLQEELRTLKDAWSRIAGGQHDRLAQFPTQLDTLAPKLEQLSVPALDQLWQGLMAILPEYVPDGPSDLDALEFATGLLLADNALAAYPDIPVDYAIQVEALLQRLANTSGSEAIPSLDLVSQEAQERLLMAQISQEIRSNLREIEEILDAYFRDTSNRNDLPNLMMPLRQVQGALLMLDRPQAVELVQMCLKRVDDFIAGESPTSSQLEDLAEALSMLGFYIDDLEQGRDSADALQPAMTRLRGATDVLPFTHMLDESLEVEPHFDEVETEECVAVDTPPQPETRPLPGSDAAIDAELLEVYQEEAVEVLATIAMQLDVARENNYDREALTLIRRGFHTLKGSGRMVGLFQLGEVAWAIEQVLNKLLQVEKPASMAVLELIEQAHEAFSIWIEELKVHGQVNVEASALIARAESLRDKLDVVPEAAADVVSSPQEDTLSMSAPHAEFVSSASEIVVGDVRVSSTLFAIFQEEAERHLDAMQHGLNVLAEQGIVEHGFILAAHTLGGIASTTGFREQGELAYALEHALQKLGDDACREVPLLTEVVSAIDGMMTSIFQRAMPGSTPDLLARLHALQAQLPELALGDDDLGFMLNLEDEDILPLGSEAESGAEPQTASSLMLDEWQVVSPITPAPIASPNENVEGLSELADVEQLFAAEINPDDEAPTANVEMDRLDAASADEATADALPETRVTLLDEAVELPQAQELDQFGSEMPELEMALDEDALLVDEAVDALPEAHVALLYEAVELPQAQELDQFGNELPELEMASESGMLSDYDELSLVADEISAVVEPQPEENSFSGSGTPEQDDLCDSDAVGMAVESPIPVVQPSDDAPISAESVAEAEFLGELETLSVVAEMDELSVEKSSLTEQLADINANLVDDIDEQLLPIFIEEADELIPAVSTYLHALSDNADDETALQRIKRTLHTMKGSARMSGAMRMGEAAHRMESRLESAIKPSEELLILLENDFDLLQGLFDEVSGRVVPETPADKGVLSAADADLAHSPAQRGLMLAEQEGKTTIRVKSDLVDELVNQAGEIVIARSRVEAEMLGLKGSLTDLTENVTRLRAQLREIEIQAESQMQAREKELEEHEARFDPLEFDRFTRLQELTRFLAESVNDVGNVQQSLLKNLDESNAALAAQSRMTRDLQQSLMRVRLVPFNSVSERLYRLVRTTGKEVGKRVNLEITGGAVEIDRGVLEKMISPFEHMLRNAIDHGLEDAAAREAANKPEFGEIQVGVRQEGNELVLTLRDDGRGLDLERIRNKALEKGLIQPDQAFSDHDLSLLIFDAGFSTASNVTQLSGRGIGMDVVKNEISNLGGRIDVSSVTGEGTTFVIRLPLSLAVTQVLLVRAGDRTIAIPAALVEQVQELKLEPLAELYAKRELIWQGQRHVFTYLPRLLGDLYRQPEQKRYSTVLLLRSGAECVALHVDELIKNMEVVVKQIGPQLARVPGVVGGTVLGHGEIVLIMNPLLLTPLAEQIATRVDPALQTLAQSEQLAKESLKTVPVVMVVDDSLTVRKITGRLLTREGYQVLTAKDGVDALQQLQDVRPDVMLVDIEMPRMDGFELTRNVRAAPDTKGIPIIMITSRTADKHRKVAFDLGVNVFLGKPYQEEELLAHIHKFIEVR